MAGMWHVIWSSCMFPPSDALKYFITISNATGLGSILCYVVFLFDFFFALSFPVKISANNASLTRTRLSCGHVSCHLCYIRKGGGGERKLPIMFCNPSLFLKGGVLGQCSLSFVIN